MWHQSSTLLICVSDHSKLPAVLNRQVHEYLDPLDTCIVGTRSANIICACKIVFRVIVNSRLITGKACSLYKRNIKNINIRAQHQIVHLKQRFHHCNYLSKTNIPGFSYLITTVFQSPILGYFHEF